MHQLYASNNELHNLILGILGLTELYLSNIQEYLQGIEDPFHLFVEFISKYTAFQNTVIGFEESFGIIFETYGEICS